jgi:uncharacterized protein (DUF2237 family)
MAKNVLGGDLQACSMDPVVLEATHASACEFIDRDVLERHAWRSECQ